jgi:glycosyltransferase involved in cell wall biosynthesis
MKVGVYNGPSGASLGGCESAVAWVASVAGALGHAVEIVHHQPWLTLEALEAFAGTSLAAATLRYVPARPEWCGSSWLPSRRFAEAREQGRQVSAGYDLFFCFAHDIPPFNHSERGILSVLFPLVDVIATGAAQGSVRQRGRRLYTRWEWSRRLASYQSHTAISEFTALWSRRRWGIAPALLYPPVDVRFPAAKKTDSIVSIGRFTRRGHPKRQDVLIEAFRILSMRNVTGLSLTSLGSLTADPEDRAYFKALQDAADGLSVTLRPNASRADIVHRLSTGAVYWHAAGFGEPADHHPERMEHFGISTVEAMAAGCVPVVINRGGQPDIVEHGVSGFVWETLDELVDYTLQLVKDERMRFQMAAAARVRARAFSIDRFRREIAALLGGESAPATGLADAEKTAS